MKKLGILALAILFALPFAVFAEGENTKQSTVSYDAGSASFEWSVPQAFTLTETEETYENYKIYKTEIPVTLSNVVLPEGKSFVVEVTAAHDYNDQHHLVKGDSAIAYDLVLPWLQFTESGTKKIAACTLSNYIQQATAFGVHSDTLTFTVSYSSLQGVGSYAHPYCYINN